MKVSVALALIVAFAAASYSAPVPKAVNWAAVGVKVREIGSLIRRAFEQIKSIANTDNSEVGAIIGVKLDVALVHAEDVLARIDAAINDQSLTAAQVGDLLGELADILGGLINDLQDDLAQLTSTAAGQIRAILFASYAQVEQKGHELYALLRQ